MSIQEKKRLLRDKMTLQRDAISLKEHERFSKAMGDKVYDLVIKKKYKVVHSYLPYKSEINLLPCLERLMQKGIDVICPKTLKNGRLEHLKLTNVNDVEYGLYDVPYPGGNNVYSGPIDLIIVPGLAFDKDGNRLGYGGGYYDRFLAVYPDANKIAVCFPFQFMDHIPTEEFDIPLNDVYFDGTLDLSTD